MARRRRLRVAVSARGGVSGLCQRPGDRFGRVSRRRLLGRAFAEFLVMHAPGTRSRDTLVFFLGLNCVLAITFYKNGFPVGFQSYPVHFRGHWFFSTGYGRHTASTSRCTRMVPDAEFRATTPFA